MLGNRVYEPSLSTHAVLETQDWKEDRQWPPPAALAHDGTSVFLATVYGYSRFNLNSLYPREQVKLGTYLLSMMVTPDGSLLIAVGGLRSNTGDQA
jgi:hypothetical protein